MRQLSRQSQASRLKSWHRRSLHRGEGALPWTTFAVGWKEPHHCSIMSKMRLIISTMMTWSSRMPLPVVVFSFLPKPPFCFGNARVVHPSCKKTCHFRARQFHLDFLDRKLMPIRPSYIGIHGRNICAESSSMSRAKVQFVSPLGSILEAFPPLLKHCFPFPYFVVP
jgi:hypothetical protein